MDLKLSEEVGGLLDLGLESLGGDVLLLLLDPEWVKLDIRRRRDSGALLQNSRLSYLLLKLCQGLSRLKTPCTTSQAGVFIENEEPLLHPFMAQLPQRSNSTECIRIIDPVGECADLLLELTLGRGLVDDILKDSGFLVRSL